MDWLLQGTARDARAAMEKGIIDEVVTDPADLVPAAKRWILEHRDDADAAAKPWDVKGFRIPGGTPAQASFASRLPAFAATLRRQLHGADLPAPKAILSAAVEGSQVDFDTASRIETRYFVSLVTGHTSSAMIQAFHSDMQALRSGAALGGPSRERSTITTAAVLGAGMMGVGIAHALALNGVDVMLKDVSLEAAERGRERVGALLEGRVAKGRMSREDADAVLARVQPTEDYQDLAHVDAVIEAVFEDVELKDSVFAEVEKVVGPDTLLCSNTSTLPITLLQGPRERSQDFIGLHFFSPVDRMKLVEIIRGEQTSPRTVERAYDLVQQIRKLPILVNDGRGFYTSRVYGTLVLEAAALVEEGVDAQRIERAARHAGFPASPLAMMDEVSLTLIQHIRREEEKAVAEAGGERPVRPGERVVERMVDEFGRPGRAQGAGFYEYPEEGPKHLWPGLAEHFATGADVPEQDLQDRLLYRMAIETARCFDDGVLTDAPSANLGGVFGIGFPPHTGGPVTFMTHREGGPAAFVARADELADRYGERFRPGGTLRQLAERARGRADERRTAGRGARGDHRPEPARARRRGPPAGAGRRRRHGAPAQRGPRGHPGAGPLRGAAPRAVGAHRGHEVPGRGRRDGADPGRGGRVPHLPPLRGAAPAGPGRRRRPRPPPADLPGGHHRIRRGPHGRARP